MNKLENFIFQKASSLQLAYARISVGLFCLVFLGGRPREDFPGSAFFQHWTPEGMFRLLDGPVDTSLYLWGLNIFNLSLVLVILGLGSRYMMVLAFLSGFWVHGYFTNFSNEIYHHSQIAILALGILSLGPVNDSLSVDNLFHKRSFFFNRHGDDYGFPLQLLFVWVVLAYFTAGYQKWISGDGLSWALSENFRLRLLFAPERSWFGDWLLYSPKFIVQGFALVGLLAEVLAPLVLWRRKLLYIFVPLWIGLHIFVSVTFGGHRAFFSQVGCYIALLVFVWGLAREVP